MLYAIAVDPRGPSGAMMLWREDVAGRLVRMGEHPTCDLRLTGAGHATCDLWHDPDGWRIRLPDASISDVVDGQSFVVGTWTVLLLVGADGERAAAEDRRGTLWSDPTAAFPFGRSRPSFESDGRCLAELADEVPMLLGGSEYCGVRIPWTHESFSGVVRRDGRLTRLYPIPGTTLRRNAAPVSVPIVLEDGDVLALSDAPALRYIDADEEIDRLLGVLRDDGPAEASSPDPPSPAAHVGIATFVGDRREAYFSIWEAALALGAATALIGQCAVTIARW